ncbi:MAG: GH1 family beta-glucosidase [Spirochaetia bacterium]|jgi:beta-glucosidase
MPASGFPKGFLWGAATSAYQIEGAARENGKGESIWDRFCQVPGAIHTGETGDLACDHYHRWRDDIENMRDLGLGAYRFSIAWPRVFPMGNGRHNSKGLDFYETLVDALLEAHIEPAATLYHWDLPQSLQDRGGWTNRDTASWFADYAASVFIRLGDRVKIWMTLNEPQVASFAGHAAGIHAPGLKDFGAAVQASHILLHAHSLGVQAYRQLSPGKHRIGIALDVHPVYPFTDGVSDIEAARLADAKTNQWFLDPVLKGAYPDDLMSLYTRNKVAPHTEPADFELLKTNPVDFIGLNYYFPVRAYASDAGGFLGFQHALKKECERTEMSWEVFPEGLYDILVQVKNEYDDPVMFITENGAAFSDHLVVDGQVQDDDRIDYISTHLSEARRAIQHGVRLEGYFLWSLMDNFEWAHGFSKRFGITHVDFHTQARTWKKSANWYQKVIASNGATL